MSEIKCGFETIKWLVVLNGNVDGAEDTKISVGEGGDFTNMLRKAKILEWKSTPKLSKPRSKIVTCI